MHRNGQGTKCSKGYLQLPFFHSLGAYKMYHVISLDIPSHIHAFEVWWQLSLPQKKNYRPQRANPMCIIEAPITSIHDPPPSKVERIQRKCIFTIHYSPTSSHCIDKQSGHVYQPSHESVIFLLSLSLSFCCPGQIWSIPLPWQLMGRTNAATGLVSVLPV